MDEPRIKAGEKQLDRMLLTLAERRLSSRSTRRRRPPDRRGDADRHRRRSRRRLRSGAGRTPTPELDKLLVFRSIHPLYGAFLLEHLGIADRDERIQALESVLEMPRPLLRYVRVPWPDKLPPGPLATTRLDEELIRRGLMLAPVPPAEERGRGRRRTTRSEEHPPTLAEKLRLLFDATHPDVTDVHTQAVWAAGELLRYGGNFNKYVQSRDLVKQEGIIFRHLLRLILLCGEFAQVCPADTTPDGVAGRAARHRRSADRELPRRWIRPARTR